MINTVGGQYIQIGTILPFGGANIPNGYLLCDGRSLSITDFQDLFNVIGYTYGGEGNSFNIPDLRNRFPQGADSNLGESIEAGLPNIYGLLDVQGANNNAQVEGAYTVTKRGYHGSGTSSGSGYINKATFNASLGETKIDGTLKTGEDYKVYGKSDTVQPPAQTVNYIIKATNVDAEPSIGDITLNDAKATQTNVFSAYKVNNELLNILSVINNIFQYETNEYGSWLQFNNGLIICWGSIERGSNLTNGGTWNSNVTLPITYTNKPKIIATIEASNGAGQELRTVNITTSSFGFSLFNRATSGSMTLPILHWFAIGK